eukprot:TRINITY_DN104331_c0_g1_i1.p1 TRINITY_DN104331_c0_g1~~TRINITY_DN104331_c0_g1_i1.p1  ORF type:complete len:139 (-),score=36.90 TRINITY_DN104331_c0_g1_i1:391-807(-)
MAGQSIAVDEHVSQLKAEGNAEVRARNFEKAIELYSQAVDLVATTTSELEGVYALYGNRCLCYMKLGKYLPAKADALEAVARNASFAKGYYRLAICQKETADLAGAWESVTKAVRLNPEDPEIQALQKSIEALERGEA